MTIETSNITAIAFDLGNVLVKVDHWRCCRELGRLAKTSPEAVFQAIFKTTLEPRFDTGRLSREKFYEGIKRRVPLNIPHLQFYSIWNEIFEPMDGIEEVLERLQPRSPLFLVSNTNEVHFQYISIRYHHLIGYFQDFILSYIAKSRKPEPGIYQALIKATGRPAHEILFIDDKLPFVEAARGQGLAAWQFTDLEDLHRRLTESGLW